MLGVLLYSVCDRVFYKLGALGKFPTCLEIRDLMFCSWKATPPFLSLSIISADQIPGPVPKLGGPAPSPSLGPAPGHAWCRSSKGKRGPGVRAADVKI